MESGLSNIASVKIYRSNQENGTYTCIATVTPKRVKQSDYPYYYVDQITYADKSVKPNTRYYYKLACLQNGYSEYGLLSEKAAMFWTAPKQVPGKAKVKKGWLKWKKVTGKGVRYAIYNNSSYTSTTRVARVGNLSIYRSSSSHGYYITTKKCKIVHNSLYSRKIRSYVTHNGKYYSHGRFVSDVFNVTF